MKLFPSPAAYVAPKLMSSTGDMSVKVLMGPAMRSAGLGQDQMLRRLTASVRESAITRHQVDFARVDRRIEAIDQLKDTLADLKHRMERKVGLRVSAVRESLTLELAVRAS